MESNSAFNKIDKFLTDITSTADLDHQKLLLTQQGVVLTRPQQYKVLISFTFCIGFSYYFIYSKLESLILDVYLYYLFYIFIAVSLGICALVLILRRQECVRSIIIIMFFLIGLLLFLVAKEVKEKILELNNLKQKEDIPESCVAFATKINEQVEKGIFYSFNYNLIVSVNFIFLLLLYLIVNRFFIAINIITFGTCLAMIHYFVEGLHVVFGEI